MGAGNRTRTRCGTVAVGSVLPEGRLTFEVTSLVDRSNDDPAARKSNNPRDAGGVGVEPHHLTRADDVSQVGGDEPPVGADHDPFLVLVAREYVLNCCHSPPLEGGGVQFRDEVVVATFG